MSWFVLCSVFADPSSRDFTRADHRLAAWRGCREIVDADGPLLARPRAACGSSDWAEGSFDKAPALFGCFEAYRLVAASNLTGWRMGNDRMPSPSGHAGVRATRQARPFSIEALLHDVEVEHLHRDPSLGICREIELKG